MKRNVGFWLLWGFALIGVSGCGMTKKQKQYTAAGFLTGAAGGAIIGLIADEAACGGELGRGIGAGA